MCEYYCQRAFTMRLVTLLVGVLIAATAMSWRAAEARGVLDETQPNRQRDSSSEKLPIPDAASLATAERQIANLLGKDLRSGSPEVRAAAAAKLLAQADGASGAIEQFAMLKAARQGAASAGDAATAFAAVRKTAARFVIDLRALRSETISALGKSVRELFDAEMTLNEAITMMREAVAADDYPAAMAIATELKPLVDRMKISDAAADFASEAKRVRELGVEYPKVKQALTKLNAGANDPAAAAVVGRFLCLRKRDWATGLPMLARGNDLKLRALADAEIKAASAGGKAVAGGTDPAEALKVADGWWDYAASQPEATRLPVHAHISDWYRTAAAGGGGMKKLLIQERLAATTRAQNQFAAQTRARWVLLLRSDDPSVWKRPAGTPIDHNRFAADVASVAPDDTAYMRLRRMDSGEYIIIPMKKAELQKQSPIWCGTAWVGYGGVHLGIKNPNVQKVQKGLVDIDGNYLGWGFGHMMYARATDGLGYAWAGETIQQTVFEIAVTADELSQSERRALFEGK